MQKVTVVMIFSCTTYCFEKQIKIDEYEEFLGVIGRVFLVGFSVHRMYIKEYIKVRTVLYNFPYSSTVCTMYYKILKALSILRTIISLPRTLIALLINMIGGERAS